MMDYLKMRCRLKYLLFGLAFLLAYILIYTIRDCSVQILNQNVNETVKALIDTSLKSQNQINLRLDIHDIYRVDISCEFITKHLGGKISQEYKNYKKCSLSSLNGNLIEKLQNSILFKDSTAYAPIYEIVEKNIFSEGDELEISKKYIRNAESIKTGGFYEPTLKANSECKISDVDFVAFIVPYMDRLENLNILIPNLHNYLINNKKYQFSYVIIVAEQLTSHRVHKFNKGQLINTAVKYVNDNFKQVDCIVLHDVDIVPAVNDSSIDYRCKQMPLHLTNQVLVLKSNWNRVYNQFLTGGILSLRPQHFTSANGFSNIFSGWGGEDDDWTLRMFNKKLCIIRPDNPVAPNAPFSMLKHGQATENHARYSLLAGSLERQFIDGYNQIEKFAKLVKETKHALLRIF